MTYIQQFEDRVRCDNSAAASGRRRTAIILCIALVLRLAVIVLVLAEYPAGWLFRSQGELGFLAQSILHGHGMTSPFGGSTGPTAFLAPGYPAMIAVIFRCFGVFTPAAALATMLLQLAFCVATVYLVMRVAEQEFGTQAANIAGVIWAIHPLYVWLPVVFWDTSLTLLFAIAAIWLTLKTVRTPSVRNWTWMGLLGACVLLVNPSLVLLLIAAFIWTVWQTRAKSHLGPVLAVAALLLIYTAWPVRNYYALHAFVPLRSNFGFELWKGNRPGATTVDDSKLYPVFNRPEYNRYAAEGEIAFMSNKTATAKHYIATHRGEFIELSIRRFVGYWTAMGTGQGAFIATLITLSTALGLLGLLLLWNEERRSLATLFLLCIALFPLPYYITHAEVRFRLVLEPVMTLLASYAVAKLLSARTGSTASIDPAGSS